MRLGLGLVTPVVNLNPRLEPPEWERRGGIDDIVEVACAAEKAEYRWVSCPEHVCIPAALAAQRGGRYWDPAVTLAFVAARTSAIGLLTHVLVLGYHHPLEVLKRYGTLDAASRGRLILGVGVGTLRPEFEVLGISYEDRGARADDAMAALRAGFARPDPAHDGPYYTYKDVIVDPCAVNGHVPIWVGGRTRRSLRRAVELGDGWIPFGLELPALARLLADEALSARRAVRTGFEVVLAPEPPLDPVGGRERCIEVVRAYAGAGATSLAVRFVHRSRDHYLEQVAALGMLVEELD